MPAMAAPILPDKMDTWLAWSQELADRADEFTDHNRRMGLTHHRAWLQRNPDGSAMAVVMHEGPGAETYLEKVAASDHAFDAWFRDKVSEIHGMHIAPGEVPPANELVIDGTG